MPNKTCRAKTLFMNRYVTSQPVPAAPIALGLQVFRIGLQRFALALESGERIDIQFETASCKFAFHPVGVVAK